MEPRIDYGKTAPDTVAAMLALETCVRRSGLDLTLLELVKTRASQLKPVRRHFSDKELVDLTLAIIAING